jgi:Holliday junction resolvase RusA-like endonuclease
MRYFVFRIPRLPDMKLVGGNKSYGHPMIRSKAIAAEKDQWIQSIRSLGYDPHQEPLLTAPLMVKVRLVYPKSRTKIPDIDNAIMALKPLMDVLEGWRITRKDLSQTRGYFGFYSDDSDIWSYQLIRVRGKTAQTVITFETITPEMWREVIGKTFYE